MDIKETVRKEALLNAEDRDLTSGICGKKEDDLDIGILFDQLLESVGSFGRYQQVVVFFVLLPTFFANSFASGFWLFVIAAPDKFWCNIPENSTQFSSSNASDSQECSLLEFQNYSSLTGNNSASQVSSCSFGWKFDQTIYKSTIVSEWNLVCSNSFLPTLSYIIACNTVGTLAAPLGGFLSDHYGRKRTYFLFIVLQFFSGLATAFSPSFWVFVILASVHSLAVYPTYQTLYALGQEILSPNRRSTFAVLVGVFYALGNVASCACAYLVRDWRMLIIFSTVPLIGLSAFWWLMPESPRFNLGQRRFRHVQHYFQRAAKWNQIGDFAPCEEKMRHLVEVLKRHDANTSKDENAKYYSFLDLFRHKKLRWRTLVLCYLSANVAVCVGGLQFYAPKLGNNPHLNVLLMALVDLPASLLTQLMADRFGRRITLAIDFIFGGTACLATLAIAADNYYSILFLFLVGRSFAVSSYTMEELVSCENFPTILRGEGISLTNAVSGIVSNLGPLIVYLCVGSSTAAPMGVFGILTILGSIVVLFLPETVNKSLPETMEDFQEFTVIRSWREFISPALPKKSG